MTGTFGGQAGALGDELAEYLREASEEIVLQWSRDLKAGTHANYAERPIDELESACRQCLDGYIAVLSRGDYTKLRRFIQRDVRLRVNQGFRASEVARGLCGFETVAWPLIAERFHDQPEALISGLERVRNCVDQALFECADVYQVAAQQKVEEYLTEMENMNRRLEELSVRDPMTGLYNRRYFHDRLTHEFRRAKRHVRPLSLIMVDVDHFKQVNDTYGHQAGDEVLRGVGLLLVSHTRATDITARYGGEEFAAVLPETDAVGALRVAEKLREQIGLAPLHRVEMHGPGSDTLAIFCTASIGVATLDHAAMRESAHLVQAADGALYEAKRSGRNRVIMAPMSDAPVPAAPAAEEDRASAAPAPPGALRGW